MKRINIIFFLIFVFVVTNSFSQGRRITHFSQEENQFLKDVETYMVKGEKKKEAKELLEKFTSVLKESGYYDIKSKENIFRISNDYLTKKKALSFPHFYNLFKTLIAFAETNHDKNDYLLWQKYMLELVTARRVSLNKINVFVVNTYNLITDNVLWKSGSVTWKAKGGNYHFSYDGKKFSVVFEGIDLKGYAKGDSTTIYATSGVYEPLKKIWRGQGGIVTWEKCKMPKDSLYARLRTYSFQIKKSAFKADSVELVYPKFFAKPILGKLEDKIVHTGGKKTPSYPKFNSYQKIFVIKNLFK
jgi:hypothetical protein